MDQGSRERGNRVNRKVEFSTHTHTGTKAHEHAFSLSDAHTCRVARVDNKATSSTQGNAAGVTLGEEGGEGRIGAAVLLGYGGTVKDDCSSG